MRTGTANPPTERPVGRKKTPKDEGEAKQYNFKLDAAMSARVDAVAEALGLDGANLLRMVLRENIAKYERRADAIRQGRVPEED